MQLLGPAMAVALLMGCAPIHEPWVNNDKAWKQDKFQSKVPNQELSERLLTTQIDR
jgi:hypothetical protein